MIKCCWVKKMKKKTFISLLFVVVSLFISSCSLLEQLNNKYRVSFYDNGSLHQQISVEPNSLLNEPSDLIKEGHLLIGWYQDLTDESTKWDFSNDLVTGHLRLEAKWESELNYITVTNFKIVENNLIWDEVEAAKYELNFLQQTHTLTTNSFSLSGFQEQLLTSKEIKVTPIKEGFIGLTETVELSYNPVSTIETYRLDFDLFDYPEFKELNRTTFKSIVIDHDDHYVYVNQGRLTKETEVPKTGVVALILAKNGFLELREPIDNFEKLEFNLGGFQNRIVDSTIELYLTNDLTADDWQLIESFEVEKAGFQNYSLTKEQVPEQVNLNQPIYIKFFANIVQGTLSTNLVIDDIVVYQSVPSHFSIALKTEDISLSDYYKSAEGLKGQKLVEELRIIVSTNLNEIRYRDIKEILEFSDVNPSNSNQVIGIYDRKLLRANWGTRSEWHREHVWPNSRLGMERVKETEVNQGSDPHNLRAIVPATNSSRSNRYYNNTTTDNILGHTLQANAYYPGDQDIGDVARILLYMVIRYEFLGLTDNLTLLSEKAYTKEAANMGLLSVLLDWHNNDPVDNFELNRNEIIYQYQNNRNPFIDHPELFEEVYNHYLSIDADRTVKIRIDYSLNYARLKREEELFC